MTIKTFDANRVGGGTFQIKQDPLTGDYKVEEVGFVKLPELKLPEIEQAAPVIPDPTPDDPTGEDPTEPGTGTGGGGSGGGGGGDQQDFTGASTYKNIKKEATGDSANLMNQATTFAGQDIQVEDIGNNPERNTALKAYNEAIDNYNKVTANIRELNASGQATDVSRKAYDISRNNAQKQLDTARKEYEYRSGLDLEGTASSETIKDAPIGNFSEGPRTVPTGTLTGAEVEDIGKTFRSETDKFKTRFDPTKIEPAEVDSNIFTKAKDVVSNSKPVQLLGIGVRMAATALENALVSPQQQALNRSNKNALSAVGYKTRGELGGSTDPGRIAGNPADNVFAGMNATSARGNIMTGSANRIKTRETVGIQRVEAKYGKNSKQAKDFRAKTETFKNQIKEAENERDNRQDKSPPKDNNRANMGMRDTSAPTTARDRAMGEAGKLSGPPRSVRFG